MYQQIPEALFELNRELANHPDIQKAADLTPQSPMMDMLVRIAAILGYSAEGHYTMEYVCDELRKILIARRLGLRIATHLPTASEEPH